MTWLTRSFVSSAFFLLCLFCTPGLGQPATNIALPEDRSVFLDRAQDLERRQLWQQAADLYQRPSASTLRFRNSSAVVHGRAVLQSQPPLS